MLAYKVLIEGRSPFTGLRWPVPSGGRPGEWVHATGPLGLCLNGVHACTVQQLPQWLGSDLWAIELAGEVLETDAALVAARGRLLGPVPRWDSATRSRYAQACVLRARAGAVHERQAELLATLEQVAIQGQVAAAGYWAGVTAGEQACGQRFGEVYERAFATERARQAQWLSDQLGL